MGKTGNISIFLYPGGDDDDDDELVVVAYPFPSCVSLRETSCPNVFGWIGCFPNLTEGSHDILLRLDFNSLSCSSSSSSSSLSSLLYSFSILSLSSSSLFALNIILDLFCVHRMLMLWCGC